MRGILISHFSFIRTTRGDVPYKLSRSCHRSRCNTCLLHSLLIRILHRRNVNRARIKPQPRYGTRQKIWKGVPPLQLIILEDFFECCSPRPSSHFGGLFACLCFIYFICHRSTFSLLKSSRGVQLVIC